MATSNHASGVQVGIAGTGRVARALGRAMRDADLAVVAVAGRNAIHAHEAAAEIGCAPCRLEELPGSASRIIIAVSDSAIGDVAWILARSKQQVDIALHTCGAKGAGELHAMQVRGTACGVLHPLQTLMGACDAARLFGTAFSISGDAGAIAWATQIVNALAGHALAIEDAARPLYHAAAVMASNNVVGLLDAAEHLMLQAGIARADALPALAPLVRAAVENSLQSGPRDALTGPVSRGDAATVETHLRAMENTPVSIRELYRAAAMHLLTIADKVTAADRARIQTVLQENALG